MGVTLPWSYWKVKFIFMLFDLKKKSIPLEAPFLYFLPETLEDQTSL